MSAKKTRPCRHGDGFPAMPRRQVCGWHWLAKQPADVQSNAAQRRLDRVSPAERRSRVSPKEWPDGGRWCAGCQAMVPLFYTRGSRCQACASRASHSGSISKTFGIDADEYERLLRLQGGRCAICRARPRSMRLAVDHDHTTGVVRGLCCKRCNHDLLGAAHDDVEVLRRAVIYLETPPTSGRWRLPRVQGQEDPGEPPF